MTTSSKSLALAIGLAVAGLAIAQDKPTPVASGPICGVTPLGMRPAAKLRYSSTRERAQ